MGSTHTRSRFDLLAAIAGVVIAVVIVSYALLAPGQFQSHLAKDYRGAGMFEHLTVIVLIPGIAAGAWAFWVRKRFPHKFTGFWILAWTLACVYFAGEESCWGQCYFRWDTPALIKSINDQGEMNFHNMSSWLDQKPRTLVELFIVASVLTAPLLRAIGRGELLTGSGRFAYISSWILAPGSLLAAGLLYMLLKGSGMMSSTFFEQLGSSELREFVIALFLSLYLMSYAARLSSGWQSPAEAQA